MSATAYELLHKVLLLLGINISLTAFLIVEHLQYIYINIFNILYRTTNIVLVCVLRLKNLQIDLANQRNAAFSVW